MQGNSEIIKTLNSLLTCELTAMDLYLVQSRVFQNLGYKKIGDQLDHEFQDELGHADKLLKRIVFLEGDANVATRIPFKVTSDVKESYEFALKFEYEVRDNLKEGINLCLRLNDHVTREIFEELLKDTEEDHIDWFETQLSLIKDLGIKIYLQEQF